MCSENSKQQRLNPSALAWQLSSISICSTNACGISQGEFSSCHTALRQPLLRIIKIFNDSNKIYQQP